MEANSSSKPYVLLPGTGKTLVQIGQVKASVNQTNGRFEVIEYAGPATPPPHVHRQREEAFYILEGSFRFVLGDQSVEAPVGSFIFIPRGTRHGFTAPAGSRALLFIAPAGLEGFFEELGQGLEAGRSSNEIRAQLAGKYDSEPI
jgi:quercetin dioxygenase-like cupin family protein